MSDDDAHDDDHDRDGDLPLAERHCRACEGGVPPLDEGQVKALMAAIDSAWELSSDGRSIAREFRFNAYARTLGFANAVAWIAIAEGHHPVLTVEYGRLHVRYTTHATDSLTDNDFICAARIDRLALDTLDP